MKTEQVRDMFDGISSRYDALNHLMSLGTDRGWRRKAVHCLVREGRPLEVLDLACGTGDLSIALARRLPEGSRITGLDLSEGMLAVMREKVAAAGLEDKVSASQGDGTALPFPDASFDAVTIAFGIRNFSDRPLGLREMLRVLRPGGTLVILELSEPENRLLRGLYRFYILRVLPLVGGLVSGKKAAYSYLPASVIRFPGRREWMQTMQAAGYAQLRHKALTLGFCRLYTGRKPF